jgi:DNA ligase-1
MTDLKRVMLAVATKDLTSLRYPMLASVKIDGVRAVNKGGHLLSRSMKPIPNKHTQSLFSDPAFEGLDGELIVGNPFDHNLMQQTTSGVMSVEGKPNVQWCVFDKWDIPAEYHTRAQIAKRIIGLTPEPFPIMWLPQKLVSNPEEVQEYEAWALGLGYEGIMLRDPRGPYKQNRSTLKEGYLLKLKRFTDAEAKITGFKEQMHNENDATLDERGYTKRSTHQANKTGAGVLGALLGVDTKDGVEVEVGTGFTLEQRINLWEGRKYLIGKIIKYKHFIVGSKEGRRFPVFLGFRSKLDMS